MVSTKIYNIVVNGEEKEFEGKIISFIEVVELAFGQVSDNDRTITTVTYARGQGNKPEGSMVNGDTVKVKEGMVFNVVRTDKS